MVLGATVFRCDRRDAAAREPGGRRRHPGRRPRGAGRTDPAVPQRGPDRRHRNRFAHYWGRPRGSRRCAGEFGYQGWEPGCEGKCRLCPKSLYAWRFESGYSSARRSMLMPVWCPGGGQALAGVAGPRSPRGSPPHLIGGAAGPGLGVPAHVPDFMDGGVHPGICWSHLARDGQHVLAPATCRRTTAAASSSCAHWARSSTTSRPGTDADRDHHDLHPPPSLSSAAKGSAPSTATANSHRECCLPLVVSRRPGLCPTHQ